MAMVTSSRTISVTWNEVVPIDQNGNITMYQVLYQPLETFVAIEASSANVTELTATLTNLQEFVTYNISVRAHTSVGAGPYSRAAVELTTSEDVPATSPTNVIAMATSPRTINVTWEEVVPLDQNGVITTHQVLYQPLETFSGAIGPLSANVTGLTTVLTDLQEFVDYSISIRAYTSVGPGPYSVEITERTHEDAPASPPFNIMARVVSSTSILVTWETIPAIDQNGIILMYEVLYQSSEAFGRVFSANVTGLMASLTDLEEYSLYTLYIRAYTSVGAGLCSQGVIERTYEDVPATPPINVMAVATLSSTITVSWGEVVNIDQNGNITMYEVLYQPQKTSGGAIGPLSVNVTELMYTLTDLESSVKYSISVRAYTSVGAGPYSDEIIVKTQTLGLPYSQAGLAVGSSLILLLFVIIVITTALLYCYRKRIQLYIVTRKKNPEESSDDPARKSSTTPRYANPLPMQNFSENQGEAHFNLRVRKTYRASIADSLLIPTNNLQLKEPVGHGEFGIVYKAILKKGYKDLCNIIVAVKTLKGILENNLIRDLLEECTIMSTFNHPNVLTLIGVCVDGGPAPYIIMPFMFNGSLLSHLKKERANLVLSPDQELDCTMVAAGSKLMDMSLQVAKGMEYLAERRLVHRDLATRNCMIDLNFVIKVADFGLSKSFGEYKDYFRQDKSEGVKLPVKWLAPESLIDGVFSEKSDVIQVA